jgi:serine phosphatase RsbU (regulator of sigma subunit)
VTGTADRLGDLVRRAQHAAPQDVAKLAAQLGGALDARLVVYAVDYAQTTLVPLAGPGVAAGEPVPVEGSLPGRAYMTLEPCESPGSGDVHLWVPLAMGPLRIGVLEVARASAGASARSFSDADWRGLWPAVATMLAHLLVDRGEYGDALELTRRRLPMQAATEVVWSLLPPVSFANNQVAISAILEPCYEVGGDVFDYSVNPGLVHVALFDAVGHGMAAALLSTLAINAYRNARRCGLGLTDTYLSVDKWVRAEYPGSFLTAVLGEFNPDTGRYRRVSAGHPAELLLRDGHWVRDFPAPTAMPLGMADLDPAQPGVTEYTMQPGDQLLVYTDGVVEARSESGEFFGVERLADFLGRAMASRLPQPETMRRLVRAILDHQHDRLQDDATALCLRYTAEANQH